MKRILPLFLLTLAVLSCRLTTAQPTQQNQDTIATLVQATLDANPPRTPLPTITQPAPDLTATAPATIPPSVTPTLTLTPTSTSTPTATPTFTDVPGDPRDALGNPTREDTFDTGAYWSPYEDSSSALQINNGRMKLTAKKADSAEYWGFSVPDVENFYLEYTGTFGDDCAGKDRFGMIFRAPKTDRGLLFGITCDGHLRLYAWDGEEYHIFKDYKKSDKINSGPGATNRFGIKAKGTKLTGYINGHEVVIKNTDLFTEGKFGAYIAAAETPGFSVKITNAAYWKLK